uniref:MYND-type domain-containing protein n=1 Tax=Tetradesmus obliquus TaxID=3088 RepID=A0A383VF54_TETOB|eukprot:jgi/Sobl393_1/11445/SZX63016.1
MTAENAGSTATLAAAGSTTAAAAAGAASTADAAATAEANTATTAATAAATVTADVALTAEAAAAVADFNAAAAIGAGPPLGRGSNGSSSSPRVTWQYLLRLHESRKLSAATAAHVENWTAADVAALNKAVADRAGHGSGTTSAEQQQAAADAAAGDLQMYQDVLTMCRTLTAVAPLPVVCNNPGCVELRGVSEAAAARHVCAGCGCRYCSAACQAADWRSHKKGCRRMAACGMRVKG